MAFKRNSDEGVGEGMRRGKLCSYNTWSRQHLWMLWRANQVEFVRAGLLISKCTTVFVVRSLKMVL